MVPLHRRGIDLGAAIDHGVPGGNIQGAWRGGHALQLPPDHAGSVAGDQVAAQVFHAGVDVLADVPPAYQIGIVRRGAGQQISAVGLMEGFQQGGCVHGTGVGAHQHLAAVGVDEADVLDDGVGARLLNQLHPQLVTGIVVGGGAKGQRFEFRELLLQFGAHRQIVGEALHILQLVADLPGKKVQRLEGLFVQVLVVDAEGDVQRRQHDQADHQQQGEKSRHHLLGEGEIVKAAQQFLHPVTSSFFGRGSPPKTGLRRQPAPAVPGTPALLSMIPL